MSLSFAILNRQSSQKHQTELLPQTPPSPPDESVITQQSALSHHHSPHIEGELLTQEEAMAEWLKDNTVLYNKGKKEYRDVDKKDALWAVQA